MKLQEKHKEFVVICFARFMTLTEIVDIFVEEFEDDLPQPDMSEVPTLEEMMERPLSEKQAQEQLEHINEYIEEFKEEYKEKFGNEADKMLNKDGCSDYNVDRGVDILGYCENLQDQILKGHEENLRKNLFDRFRRLNIDHRQFPDKYKALFHNTRDEFCANYRIPDLNVPENAVRELETLYGYQKQCIFEQRGKKDVMQHVTLAHQILKTIVACNAITAEQEVVDVTPQDVEALKAAQKALPTNKG